MNIAVIIATCGDQKWGKLASERAYPSADGQCSTRPSVTIRHYPELSLAQARNAAAWDAPIDDQTFFCFLDADDELEPGYLAAMELAWMRGAITTDWAPLLVPAVRYVGPPRPDDVPASIPNRGRWPALNECVIGTLVRAELFRQVGGFRDYSGDLTPLSIYEDWDLFLRCYDAGAQLVYVEEAVYRAHVNPQGRNGGPDAKVVYDAIWADHTTRTRDRSELV